MGSMPVLFLFSLVTSQVDTYFLEVGELKCLGGSGK